MRRTCSARSVRRLTLRKRRCSALHSPRPLASSCSTANLERLGARARLIVTSVFTSNASALSLAAEMGTRIRILNPSGGTYHPKLYLSRGAGGASAFIGSANLTSGLVGNIEIGVALSGSPTAAADHAWLLGEALWAHKSAVDWIPACRPPKRWNRGSTRSSVPRSRLGARFLRSADRQAELDRGGDTVGVLRRDDTIALGEAQPLSSSLLG